MKKDENLSASGEPLCTPPGALPLDPRYRLTLHALTMVRLPLAHPGSAPSNEEGYPPHSRPEISGKHEVARDPGQERICRILTVEDHCWWTDNPIFSWIIILVLMNTTA